MNIQKEHYPQTQIGEFTKRIIESIKINNPNVNLIGCTPIEFDSIKIQLHDENNSKVLEIINPFFPDRSACNLSDVTLCHAFFDKAFAMVWLKMPCIDYSPKIEKKYLSIKDLHNLQGYIILVKNIDLFDYKSQNILSKFMEHSIGKSQVILQFDPETVLEHLNNVAVNNCSIEIIQSK